MNSRKSERVTKWLESDVGGGFYAFMSNTAILGPGAARVGFAVDEPSFGRLEQLVSQLSPLRTHTSPEWPIYTYDDSPSGTDRPESLTACRSRSARPITTVLCTIGPIESSRGPVA